MRVGRLSQFRYALIGALVLAPMWPTHARAQVAHAPALTSQHQSLWAPRVLHAPCLGVEGEPQRRIRELAPQSVVRRVQRADSMTPGPIEMPAIT